MKVVVDLKDCPCRLLDCTCGVSYHECYACYEDDISKSCPLAVSSLLPEGHGDLIDKQQFKHWIETQDGDKLMTEYYLDALEEQDVIVESDET